MHTKQPRAGERASLLTVLALAGYTREFNGGGCHVWLKPMANGWTVSVCNGAADEPAADADSVHINAHRSDDCEYFTPGAFVRGEQLGEALAAFEVFALCLHLKQ